MRIKGSDFGKITIDGRTYEHDVIIRLSGDVEKRRKKLSKRQYGTSHMISKAEAKFVFEKGCDVVIVGSGHQGNVQLSPEARDYFQKKRCNVILQPTPEAIRTFNRSKAHKDWLDPRNLLKRSLGRPRARALWGPAPTWWAAATPPARRAIASALFRPIGISCGIPLLD